MRAPTPSTLTHRYTYVTFKRLLQLPHAKDTLNIADDATKSIERPRRGEFEHELWVCDTATILIKVRCIAAAAERAAQFRTPRKLCDNKDNCEEEIEGACTPSCSTMTIHLIEQARQQRLLTATVIARLDSQTARLVNQFRLFSSKNDCAVEHYACGRTQRQ